MGRALAWIRTPFQWQASSLWISWIAVHILGALLPLAVIPQIPVVKAANTATILVTGVVCFLLVSMLQDAVLAYHVPGLRFGKWSALTVTAGVAAGFVGGCVLSLVPWSTTTDDRGTLIAEMPSAIERVLLVMIIGAVIGVIVGVAQSLILPERVARLRGKLSQRSVWVLSSVVAWFLSFGTIAWTVRFLDNPATNSINAYDVDGATVTLALVSGATIIGAVSAIALTRLFEVFQGYSGTSSSQPNRVTTVGIGIIYAMAAIIGALFLWGSYTLVEASFLWPYGYTGPTYHGSPDEYFLTARVLTGGMVAISAIYTLLFSILSLKAFQKSHLSVEQHRTRYWAMILAASIVLVCFNVFAALTWAYEYLD